MESCVKDDHFVAERQQVVACVVAQKFAYTTPIRKGHLRHRRVSLVHPVLLRSQQSCAAAIAAAAGVAYGGGGSGCGGGGHRGVLWLCALRVQCHGYVRTGSNRGGGVPTECRAAISGQRNVNVHPVVLIFQNETTIDFFFLFVSFFLSFAVRFLVDPSTKKYLVIRLTQVEVVGMKYKLF